MRRCSWLLILAGFFAFISGCDEEPDKGPAPRVIRVSVEHLWNLPGGEGWHVPSNAEIFVTFSKEMANESVVISLNNIPVSAAPYEETVLIFTPEREGEFELAITGEDLYGQKLSPPYEPVKFTVVGLDAKLPELVNDECEPENGAQDVDPGIRSFVVAFSERMFSVMVDSVFPEFPFSKELSADGRFLTIKLENGYRLSSGMHVNIQFNAKDLIGHLMPKSEEYTFTTMR